MGKQRRLSKSLLKKMGKISKEYEFNTNRLHGKAYVCDLDHKSRHEWGWYSKISFTKTYKYIKYKPIQQRISMILNHKSFNKNVNKNSKSVTLTLITGMSPAVHLAVACDVYDGVFLCCPFSHEVSWIRS